MPKIDLEGSQEPKFQDLDSPASVEIKQLIAKLHHSHELWYKMINLESWALASTMDQFLPGFWSRFLENRRIVLKQFLQNKRKANSKAKQQTNQ